MNDKELGPIQTVKLMGNLRKTVKQTQIEQKHGTLTEH